MAARPADGPVLWHFASDSSQGGLESSLSALSPPHLLRDDLHYCTLKLCPLARGFTLFFSISWQTFVLKEKLRWTDGAGFALILCGVAVSMIGREMASGGAWSPGGSAPDGGNSTAYQVLGNADGEDGGVAVGTEMQDYRNNGSSIAG